MRLLNRAIIFIFFFIIFCVYAGQFLGITSVRDSVERRDFTQFPVLNISDPKLTNALDSYFTYNFGFRNILIKQYLFLKLNLLKTGNVFRVFYGSNGMTFGGLAPGSDYKEYYQKLVYTQDQLNDFKGIFEKEKKYLDQRKVPYFVVIIPDRRLVYDNLLPFNDKLAVRRHYQFVDFIRENSSVELIDVTDALIRAKNRYPLFFKTDSHWTNYGAFIAYTEIMKHLNKYTSIEPLEESDFDISLEKYDIWVGDAGMNYPGNPGRPEVGVKFTPKAQAIESKKKLNSILEYGDSFLNFSRTICIPCMIAEIPETESIISLLFVKPSSNRLIDTNPGYWLPKDKIENLIPIIRENIKDKQTQDYIINYLIKHSIFPGVVGLDYFLRLGFDTVVRGDDLTYKLNQALIDKYKPDLVIREVIDNRLWEYYRLKCNYDTDGSFNNINAC